VRDTVLTLADGRRLCSAEYGAPDGEPAIYCHGWPGSRLEAGFADTAARRAGVRLIAPDRPGFGQSDFLPGRDIPVWAEDIRELTSELALESFSVLGVSGGAPYALACAAALPERVSAVTIVSGLGPPAAVRSAGLRTSSGLVLRLVAFQPWFARVVASLVSTLARGASSAILGLLTVRSPPSDRRALREPSMRNTLSASLREAFRSGARGAAADLRLLSSSWGFEIAEVRAPVRLWHGEEDRVVSPSVGRFLDSALPTCRATYLEHQGHYSPVNEHADLIIASLTPR
jgi:pimeloyl-ACP methyl ester carboxylesterase